MCNIGICVPFVILTTLNFFLVDQPFSWFEPRILSAIFSQKKHLSSYPVHKSSFTFCSRVQQVNLLVDTDLICSAVRQFWGLWFHVLHFFCDKLYASSKSCYLALLTHVSKPLTLHLNSNFRIRQTHKKKQFSYRCFEFANNMHWKERWATFSHGLFYWHCLQLIPEGEDDSLLLCPRLFWANSTLRRYLHLFL